MSAENVNHPYHYTQGGIECIEAIRASMPPEGFQDYCKGNVLKYIWRWRDKGGAEDLEKAKVYLQWAIDSAEGKEPAKGAWSMIDFGELVDRMSMMLAMWFRVSVSGDQEEANKNDQFNQALDSALDALEMVRKKHNDCKTSN